MAEGQDPERQEAERGIPCHVAIIMDGNGRWARRRFLPHTVGHRNGAEAVRRTVRGAAELGIAYLTLYGFSTENWKRPASEVDDLMGLLRHYLRSEIAELHSNDICLRVIGNRDRLPDDIVRLITAAEERTRDNKRITLTIALNYGAREEILAAIRRIAVNIAEGKIQPEAIGESHVMQYLATAGIPDPDLIIRTSGEQRLSNFLLWQAAYSEFLFIDTLWPDFAKIDLERAIAEFQKRERRFGARVG